MGEGDKDVAPQLFANKFSPISNIYNNIHVALPESRLNLVRIHSGLKCSQFQFSEPILV